MYSARSAVRTHEWYIYYYDDDDDEDDDENAEKLAYTKRWE